MTGEQALSTERERQALPARPDVAARRIWTKRFVRALAVLAALLATVQPVLGSFSLFRGGDSVDYERLHLVVGGILYNIVLLLALLALFARFRHRWLLVSICVLQYGLVHLELRLGLGSNDDAGLLAYHIPVGVLIVLVSYLTTALSLGLGFQSDRA